MSVQLGLYWRSADNLQWLWSDAAAIASGSLEELVSARQQRNLASCSVRLFLPISWFAGVDVQLPVNSRRPSPQLLKFAAEEYLAQDIESVHLVLLGRSGRSGRGDARVEVVDQERLAAVLRALQARQFVVPEAYNCQPFLLPEEQTEDLLLLVRADEVLCSHAGVVHRLAGVSFSAWFGLWAEQTELAQDASIRVIADDPDGPSKALVAEFEASGYPVQWVIEELTGLPQWQQRASLQKPALNLIAGPFAINTGLKNSALWLPAALATLGAILLWSLFAVLAAQRLQVQAEQTWQASESIFLQVFGQDKRIQRPLMTRELRALIGGSEASAGAQQNALTLLADISTASSDLLLEDFRFSAARSEAVFTLAQPTELSSDAYSAFESLKSDLTAKAYQVEYSANQDSAAFKARFTMTYGANEQ